MPDRTNSTPFVPLPTAQDRIMGIAAELVVLEEQLATVATDPRDQSEVAQHLRVGAACVRTDLLADAIETLLVLAAMTGESARDRDAEVIAAAKSVAVFC